MMINDLENELRNLKSAHLNESEIVAYCDQELDQAEIARVEAHLNKCFICQRHLVLLREESEALSKQEITSDDIELVERMMEQMGLTQKKTADGTVPTTKLSVQERFAEYLQQMIASWRIRFGPEAMRSADQGKEIWRWESEDGKLQARAIMENNADLTIHLSSNEIDLEGTRLRVSLGLFSQEIILWRVSESEVHAQVAVPPQYRHGKSTDISIERI